jgi:hypothetical protein
MSQKQIFLLLTSSFMAAMSDQSTPHGRVQRALEAAVKFAWDDNLDPDKSAFEYAKWVITCGKPPVWLPRGFNHGYLG